MKNIKDHRQMNIFDPWGFLSSKLRELLNQSWAGLFQKEILSELPGLDSVHIKSNMRRLGRIGIFTSSINKFLVNLERENKELFDTIDKGLVDKIFGPSASRSMISREKALS